jgi:hypothetical protein
MWHVPSSVASFETMFQVSSFTLFSTINRNNTPKIMRRARARSTLLTWKLEASPRPSAGRKTTLPSARPGLASRNAFSRAFHYLKNHHGDACVARRRFSPVAGRTPIMQLRATQPLLKAAGFCEPARDHHEPCMLCLRRIRVSPYHALAVLKAPTMYHHTPTNPPVADSLFRRQRNRKKDRVRSPASERGNDWTCLNTGSSVSRFSRADFDLVRGNFDADNGAVDSTVSNCRGFNPVDKFLGSNCCGPCCDPESPGSCCLR